MAEYIEREALMARLEERRDYLFKENGDYDHYSNGFDEAVDKVDNFPAADVVERKRVEWVEVYHEGYEMWSYDCPFCDDGFAMKERCTIKPNFCGNCGADMRGEKHEDRRDNDATN